MTESIRVLLIPITIYLIGYFISYKLFIKMGQPYRDGERRKGYTGDISEAERFCALCVAFGSWLSFSSLLIYITARRLILKRN